jgi:hypothetical protein
MKIKFALRNKVSQICHLYWYESIYESKLIHHVFIYFIIFYCLLLTHFVIQFSE